MVDRFNSMNNSHRPMKINREVRTVDKSEVQHLQKNTSFKKINFINISELGNQILIPDFIFLAYFKQEEKNEKG